MKTDTRNSTTFLLISLGMASAMGPFVTDFYLPALPQLTTVFSTTSSAIQMSLTLCLIGLAIGQLFIGPISDKYGRKMPLIVSMVIFSLATLCCLLTTDIYIFLACRFLQGLSGAGGIVISKSVASDLHTGKELVHFFAVLGCVQGIAPICAPFLGGLLLSISDWQGIFYTLFGIGIVLSLIFIPFHESLPDERRQKGSIYSGLKHYKAFFTHKEFMVYMVILTLTQGILFIYISSSTFIFQQTYGLSALLYGVCFGLNSLSIMAGSLFAGRIGDPARALNVGEWGAFIAVIASAACIAAQLPFLLIELSIWAMLFFMGIIFTMATTLALDLERNNAGSASALIGFFSFLAGGIAAPITGMGNMLYSTAGILAVFGLLLLGAGYYRRHKLPAK
ncbi:MAG TPA: multidrug effflux MFS transporter [Candidatus Barnesiella excrementipullorum]|uniref:Multidrug effflux MFS transporter n=1 Tax=Candidatus Barnesiella excrementipullorum TaxID=2838479 RepID=A0A9D2ANR8_9BACT|nr:multidrug effflux MFS transporter [Candidatus Barnesiella excrementipullorum]